MRISKIKSSVFVTALVILTLALSSPALARRGYKGQRGPGAGMGPGGNPEIRAKMDTIKLVKLVDALNLNEAEAVKLSTIFKKHREKTTELRTKMQQIAKDMKDNISANIKKNDIKLGPKAKKIKALVATYLLIKKKLHDQRLQLNKDVLEMLDPVKQGKYVLFQETFPKQLRRNMRDFRRNRINNKRPAN